MLKSCYILLTGFVISMAGVTVIDKQVSTKTNNLVFYDSIGAIESICPDRKSMKIYAGDLNGFVHILDGQDRNSLKLIKSTKVAKGYCTGIILKSNNELCIGISDGIGNWGKQKCYIIGADSNISVTDTIAGPDILINGIAIDTNDNLYFATGEFSLLFPKPGFIKKLSNTSRKPEVLISDCKRPNGLFYQSTNGKLFFTKTLDGIFSLNPETKEESVVIGNKKLVDASDDLCIDKSGDIWVANPPKGFIKCYQPDKNLVIYFKSKDFGTASSCRIRVENGEEVLYISEIRNPKGEYKGRGIISIPVKVLKNL